VSAIADCKSILNNADQRVDIEELLDLSTFMTRMATIKDYLDLCARCMSCFKSDSSSIGQTFPNSNDMARPVRHFIVEFYRRQLIGVASTSLSLSVVNYAESVISEFPFHDLNDLTKVAVDRRIVYPATKEKVQFMSIELNALCTTLEKFTTALALEQKLEAIFACQQVKQPF
jgi:hypothetical protein